MDQSE